MKILFDLQGLQNNSKNRGIGRYVRSLFDALARRQDIELHALLNTALSDDLAPIFEFAAGHVGRERILLFPGLHDTAELEDGNPSRKRLSELVYEAFVAETNCDVLLVGTLVEGAEDETTVSLKMPFSPYLKAVILYDLIPLLDPEKHIGWIKLREWYLGRISHLESADLLLGISNSSTQEAYDHLNVPNGKAIPISTAIDESIFNLNVDFDSVILDKLKITKPFVMNAGVIEPRKNFHGLVEAFATLPRKVRDAHQLVLIGTARTEAEAELRALAKIHGLDASDLIIPGFVPDDELAQLYRAAKLFVYPSLHEGFGLPALEAMACGCPAIGSNVTSVPEVIGDPAYQFDPTNPEAIRRMMQMLLTSPEALEKAARHAVDHAATFSWDGVGERAMNAIAAAVGNRPKSEVRYPSAERMALYVAKRTDLSECHASEFEAVARSLASAEDALVSWVAAGLPKEGFTWRIEGPFDSSYSLALVNRETARALADLGYRVALHSTEGPGDFPASPHFLEENPDLAQLYERAANDRRKRPNLLSRLLYPPRVADASGHINALHNYAWEETAFPQQWRQDFNSHLTMMTTLSTHVQKIMVDNGVSVPSVVSGCGVDHWERIVADREYRVDARSFRFLHVSSCFPRKGVDALLKAYESAFTIHDEISLVIKTFDNPHNDLIDRLALLRSRNPHFPHVVTIFADLSDAQMKALYAECHVMVGPSCAEGYGLPFAEAMLSGIPVITTAWGGQLDFCNPGNSWLVDYSFERAQSHFGLWSSAWARPDEQSLARAMREAYATAPSQRALMARRGREQLMMKHTWRHVAQRLSAAADRLPKLHRKEPRIGWVTSWLTQCGIATYSQHLIDEIDAEITIFSPVIDTPTLSKDNSIRCWHQSKSESELWRILARREFENLDVIVIQFNFGFYNHSELSRFIFQVKAMGKSAVVIMHSTIDPPTMPEVDDWRLAPLVNALAICDRVLVHAIDDLNRMKDRGLIDNVALFPHGSINWEPRSARPRRSKGPIIATYGFALPHKGLPEMLQALRLMLNDGREARLRMVNAEYPVDASSALLRDLKRLACELELTDHVEMYNGFLLDEECLELLAEADLVIFPYQETFESASGAVRYGLAAGRPVAVTPLPIFNDVEEVTFRLDGTSPLELANGIGEILDAIEAGSSQALQIVEKAAHWRSQHNYRLVASRLQQMCKALIYNR